MIKVGDMVLITDMGCVNHTDGCCCDCNLTQPVEVTFIDKNSIEIGCGYPIEVILPNGETCLFAIDEVQKVEVE